MCKMYSNLISNNAKGNYTLLVQIDLSTAFDTVVVTMLLSDQLEFGIDGAPFIFFLVIFKEVT